VVYISISSLFPYDATCNKLSNMATLLVTVWNFSTDSKGHFGRSLYHSLHSSNIIILMTFSGVTLHRTECLKTSQETNISIVTKNAIIVYFPK
jgi:hypothetical protein